MGGGKATRGFSGLISGARHLPRALGLCWAAAPRWTTAWGALLILSGLLPVALVYLTRALVDGLTAALEADGGEAEIRSLILYVVLLAGVLLLMELLRAARGWVRTAQSELVRDHVVAKIQAQSVAADLAFYETPDYFDHLHRAKEEARHRPVELLESLGALLSNGITLLAMAAVLLPFGVWVPLVLFASTLPALFVVLRHTVRLHRWRRLRTADDRKARYLDWLLTTSGSAAEVRLFDLGEKFRGDWARVREVLRTERIRLARRQALAEGGAGVLGLALSALALGLMVVRAARGGVSLGELAMFYQAFHQGQRLMRGLLGDVGSLYRNILFLSDLFEFLALEPRVTAPAEPLPAPAKLSAGIRFRGVGFSYPGSHATVLEDFDLEIPAGSTVAVVGGNGAGKSTLLKLVCRLYDPDGGAVELDGTDLRRFRPEELRRRLTVLFQEPVHYHATAGENIAYGDVDREPELPDLVRAAESAGAEEIVAGLPQGYESILGKWFPGGTELSPGEWQRVALARAFLREAPVLLLDEPTSAMDSWAEADWMERFGGLAEGRTVLLITHRFTTARRADLIHVMENGVIVESGSHDELLATGGRYAVSWRAQVEGSD